MLAHAEVVTQTEMKLIPFEQVAALEDEELDWITAQLLEEGCVRAGVDADTLGVGVHRWKKSVTEKASLLKRMRKDREAESKTREELEEKRQKWQKLSDEWEHAPKVGISTEEMVRRARELAKDDA